MNVINRRKVEVTYSLNRNATKSKSNKNSNHVAFRVGVTKTIIPWAPSGEIEQHHAVLITDTWKRNSTM